MKLDKSGQVVLGNVYDKYTSTNPIARLLFRNFLSSVEGLLARIDPGQVLEVGCGEGMLSCMIRRWKPQARVVGVDLESSLFDRRATRAAGVDCLVQSAYDLGFRDQGFDLVVAAEVLEHLDDPPRALAEIQRVARGHLLFSVPREPIWRVLNLARLSYVRDWGNTPGHVQHWSSRGFRRMIGERFEVVAEARPLPWTVLLARAAGT